MKEIKHMDKAIEEIAKELLSIDTLETRLSDSMDFHDCAVWQIKKALEEAWCCGYNIARTEHPRPLKEVLKGC